MDVARGEKRRKGTKVDVARGEMVEKELDAMIVRRSCQKDPDEESELWQESVRLFNTRRREENRLAWHEYHQGQAERLRRTMGPLIAFHEGEAARLYGEERP